jgi:hypothetical protein
MDDDVFDKLRFINEIGTQFPSQLGEEDRTYSVQDTGAVIHGENQNVAIGVTGEWQCSCRAPKTHS